MSNPAFNQRVIDKTLEIWNDYEASRMEVKVGDIFTDTTSDFRIMAIAEGYFMARRKGALPFIAAIKDLQSVTILPKPSATDATPDVRAKTNLDES